MRIIPAIDILEGKCVRLSSGDYTTKKVYNENPVEVAKQFEANGITDIHVVDLDGAKSHRIVNHRILEQICTHTNLHVDFGGGLKSDEDLKIAFESGARQITGGSIAVRAPKTFKRWLMTYGTDRIILGADCYQRKIAMSGWQEHADIDVVDFIRQYQQAGISYVICTDIAKDGMLKGPAIDLYNEIIASIPVKLIASGGVSSRQDLQLLKETGCTAAIVGKAFYEGVLSFQDLKELC